MDPTLTGDARRQLIFGCDRPTIIVIFTLAFSVFALCRQPWGALLGFGIAFFGARIGRRRYTIGDLSRIIFKGDSLHDVQERAKVRRADPAANTN